MTTEEVKEKTGGNKKEKREDKRRVKRIITEERYTVHCTGQNWRSSLPFLTEVKRKCEVKIETEGIK